MGKSMHLLVHFKNINEFFLEDLQEIYGIALVLNEFRINFLLAYLDEKLSRSTKIKLFLKASSDLPRLNDISTHIANSNKDFHINNMKEHSECGKFQISIERTKGVEIKRTEISHTKSPKKAKREIFTKAGFFRIFPEEKSLKKFIGVLNTGIQNNPLIVFGFTLQESQYTAELFSFQKKILYRISFPTENLEGFFALDSSGGSFQCKGKLITLNWKFEGEFKADGGILYPQSGTINFTRANAFQRCLYSFHLPNQTGMSFYLTNTISDEEGEIQQHIMDNSTGSLKKLGFFLKVNSISSNGSQLRQISFGITDTSADVNGAFQNSICELSGEKFEVTFLKLSPKSFIVEEENLVKALKKATLKELLFLSRILIGENAFLLDEDAYYYNSLYCNQPFPSKPEYGCYFRSRESFLDDQPSNEGPGYIGNYLANPNLDLKEQVVQIIRKKFKC